MLLNQRHHKIFTTLSVTVQQSLQTKLVIPSHFSLQFNTNIFLSVSYEDKRNADNTNSFVFQSWIQTYQLSICSFFLEMKLSRKDPLREKHSFVFLMREKPLQTLAGSVWVCYHFCWWLGTVSQGTRRYRPFQFACAAVKLGKINHLSLLEELLMTLQTSAAQHSTAWLQHQQPEMPSEFWSESLLGEWSENSFFALKALFRGGGVQWVDGGAGCLWEMFWTAHGRGWTQSTAALKMKIFMATLSGTANDALCHHLHNKK